MGRSNLHITFDLINKCFRPSGCDAKYVLTNMRIVPKVPTSLKYTAKRTIAESRTPLNILALWYISHLFASKTLLSQLQVWSFSLWNLCLYDQWTDDRFYHFLFQITKFEGKEEAYIHQKPTLIHCSHSFYMVRWMSLNSVGS